MSNWMWHPYFLNILDVDVDVVLNILDVMGVDVDVDVAIHTQHSLYIGCGRLAPKIFVGVPTKLNLSNY